MLLGLVLAVALEVSVTLVQVVSADLGVVRTVRDAGRDGQVTITLNDADDAGAFAYFVSSARQRVLGTAGGLLQPGAAYLTTGSLNVDTLNARPPSAGLRPPAPALATYGAPGPPCVRGVGPPALGLRGGRPRGGGDRARGQEPQPPRG
jgi:hypothetical protein